MMFEWAALGSYILLKGGLLTMCYGLMGYCRDLNLMVLWHFRCYAHTVSHASFLMGTRSVLFAIADVVLMVCVGCLWLLVATDTV